MVSDLAARKYAQTFELFDVSGDGYIQQDDCSALAERLITTFAGPGDAIKAKTVRDSYQQFWEGVSALADTDHDGRISREEYVAAMAAVAGGPPETFDEVIQPLQVAVFALCDTDGDGRIDAGEFQAMHTALGTGDDDSAIRALARLDTDGDGVLSVEELLRAARQFVLDESPDAPGNWLFGGVDEPT
jgi:Ca2+-binding EF-hand superfamily protein